jgi:hypothetical protein
MRPSASALVVAKLSVLRRNDARSPAAFLQENPEAITESKIC